MLNKKSSARGGKTQNEGLWYYIISAVIAFIVIGLTISYFGKKEMAEKTSDPAALEKIITELKIENLTVPESKSKGKIIPPVPQYEVDQLRQSLDLQEPEKEKNEIKLQHEEILKKNSKFQYVF